MAKGRVTEKEEVLDGAVTDIEANFTELKQDLANQGFATVSTPDGGGPGAKTGGAAAVRQISMHGHQQVKSRSRREHPLNN